MDLGLRGRTALITGAASGIGRACAAALAAETSDEEWELGLRTNLTTAFVMARETLPALIGLTRSLARDYGKQGVRVNAVCPGWVQTPMADGEMDEFMRHGGLPDRAAAYAAVTADVPLGRPAQPEEIAAIVRFLGSAESSYITGSIIVADGGAHIVDVPTISFEHAGR